MDNNIKKSSSINWFPGHMTKALRQMEKELKNIDIVLYCLDARAPFSCINPKLTKLCQNKKIIYVVTKVDFVEENDLKFVKNKLDSTNSKVVFVNATKSNSCKQIFSLSKNLLSQKLQNKLDRGLNYQLKAMVVGVPNVGKSTIINNLCKTSKTITGNKPGVTRGKQWVMTEGGLNLLDTPGTLWPSFDDDKVAKNLAYIGSIKDEVLDLNDLAFNFLKDILPKYKNLIESRYNINIKEDSEILEIFDQVCLSRKCVLKGNELDYDRCSKIILDDFRKGRTGKIFLD